jgi:hypothetical protein
MPSLLWTAITVLIVLWLLGQVLSFGGPLIHIVIVAAVFLLVFKLMTKGRAAL